MDRRVVFYARQGDVGVITVDSPPVNALSQAVRQGIGQALAEGLADAAAKALVILGAGRTFIAGADIAEFLGSGLAEPDLNDINAAIESSPKPVIAAIHGTALGGGLEVALSCHYRVATSDAQVGLPEVKLGLLPGAGGTQRLPRLIGVAKALALITSGDFLPATDAMALGLLDHVGSGTPLELASAFAASLPASPPLPRASLRSDRLGLGDGAAVAAARQKLADSAPWLHAPQRCIDAVEAAFTLPFVEGLARERALFWDCIAHDQSKALIHAFFAERAAAKVAGLGDAKPRPVTQVGVIGSGTMGGGIAMCFANAGIPVTLLDMDKAALERGIGIIARNYAATVAKGRLTQATMDKRLSLITQTTDYADLSAVDLVVEAAYEDMAVKQAVFARLGDVTKPGAVLASNTSTLDIDAIAAASGRPADVVGMHFFSPANVMKLLEVVRGRDSAADAIQTAMSIGRKIGKVAVAVGNCDGFVGNRMLQYYATEAQRLVIEGASVAAVDQAARRYGLAMGPFAMGDMAGLDVMQAIRDRRVAEGKIYGTALSDLLTADGRKGQKNGRGWYHYEPGDRTPRPDPAVAAMVDAYRQQHGITPRTIGEEEIQKRLVYALVNEGARILEEGMAQSPGDIDIVYLYGYGFPAWRGGPMKQAELTGLADVLADITRFAQMAGDDPTGAHWSPAPLLVQLVAEGRERFG
ncbi:3-hydroxyacyl-CoA dehydrogenase [Niveispirillum sp. SYP-B3756]|uniref:3-hydroxyacyl-CoA dehydrogenase NAD-binding domain-containing protein n=1 Tax=Niveispirillum sp. SYP-B3756 TaxID=2662178 RepID=UPI001290FB7B|nr:3-hydroxyacyl-CoA dehydrogenase NAD-binding domain-containing protein [Niveispirillum sp. SYP-B3756]MQP66668.1 3-hydroxyacyl-CoA dehydrogenase [Niveispirillum sp. SYP-B3756]